MATTTDLDDDTKRDVRAEFGEAVNMTAAQLKKWLDAAGVTIR